MDTIQLIYLILSITTMAVIGIVILILAGKDILFAIKRKVFYKGADVFVVNKGKQITRYFLMPKDGKFTIKKKTYITNPEKVLSFGVATKQINLSLQNKIERLDKTIDKFKEKIKKMESLINQSQGIDRDKIIEKFAPYIENLKQKIEMQEKKKETFEEVYYFERRPAYFYIEDDPVPKDFFELLTEMDVQQLDNMIARSLTQDPKKFITDLEKLKNAIKILLLIAAVGAGIAAFFAFKNHSYLQQIAANSGITLTV